MLAGSDARTAFPLAGPSCLAIAMHKLSQPLLSRDGTRSVMSSIRVRASYFREQLVLPARDDIVTENALCLQRRAILEA
jgi:hypothetical protein